MSYAANGTDGPGAGREIFSVSRLNQTARKLLEGGLPRIWVEGELSNIARPSSGHLYFTLKDSQAQVRGAMFRNRNQLLRFRPEEGMQVLVRARVSLYEPRGDYQLIADHMEEAGAGVLLRAFEALKQKLEQEGLFEAAGKQPLPALPGRIGVITSPTGAAIRDVLSVLKRRFPAIPVLVYPVPVQGKEAGRQIAAMITTAALRRECDVLLLTRGGGSLEDLWAFNEEIVARAVHACPIPIVSAVGHEIDFTIADFVADRRAPTPSAAAELLSPDQSEWLARIRVLQRRSGHHIRQALADRRQRLSWLLQRLRLRHPDQILRQQAQHLDELEQRAGFSIINRINKLQTKLNEVLARLKQATPEHRIARTALHQQALVQRLHAAMETRLQQRRQRLSVAARTLDTVSPLATLERGYAIVSRHRDGRVVRRAAMVEGGERIEARLAAGRLLCTVDEVLKS
ncbi:MAG: exodeoxyribonuclease VII large subunit [Gammaproteobacteria bacterium]|jgi:exodeoxyribonuclease VII large subunit